MESGRLRSFTAGVGDGGCCVAAVVVVAVVDHFYVVLFSALEQTQCALAACESK